MRRQCEFAQFTLNINVITINSIIFKHQDQFLKKITSSSDWAPNRGFQPAAEHRSGLFPSFTASMGATHCRIVFGDAVDALFRLDNAPLRPESPAGSSRWSERSPLGMGHQTYRERVPERFEFPLREPRSCPKRCLHPPLARSRGLS